MQCRKCETQFPDMCSDCLEVIQMDFSGVVPDDIKAFEASFPKVKEITGISAKQKVYQSACGRINVASGEDMPLQLGI